MKCEKGHLLWYIHTYIVLVNGKLAKKASNDPVIFLVLHPKNHHLYADVGVYTPAKNTSVAQAYKRIFRLYADVGVYTTAKKYFSGTGIQTDFSAWKRNLIKKSVNLEMAMHTTNKQSSKKKSYRGNDSDDAKCTEHLEQCTLYVATNIIKTHQCTSLASSKKLLYEISFQSSRPPSEAPPSMIQCQSN